MSFEDEIDFHFVVPKFWLELTLRVVIKLSSTLSYLA